MNNLYRSPDTTYLPAASQGSMSLNSASIFTGHQLKCKNIAWSPHFDYPDNWISLALLLGFILYAWVYVLYFRRLQQIWFAPLAQRFLNILTKNGNLFRERAALILFLIYLFTFGLVITRTIMIVSPSASRIFPEYQLCILCALAVAVFWTGKILTILFLGNVFGTRDATYSYIHNELVFCLINGVILLPLLILTVFLNSVLLLYIILVIIALIFFFRVLRGFLIGISVKKFSYLFLIVYLCALEILPVLVILKGFQNFV